MKQETLLKIEDGWKKYNMGGSEPLIVLKEINLEIKKGEFVAITGPSGSGKSTMMHLVGCLDKPSKGEVFLEGKKISLLNESSLAEIRGKKIGFIFQQFNLIPTLTAFENVMLPGEFQDQDEAIKGRAKKLLEVVGLQDRMNHKPTELSGGQEQRVAIARSLINNPELILADEPTGCLDSKTGEYIMNFLCELNEKEGKTIIIVTHDTELIKFAGRIIKLKDGMIEKDIQNNKKIRRKTK